MFPGWDAKRDLAMHVYIYIYIYISYLSRSGYMEIISPGSFSSLPG